MTWEEALLLLQKLKDPSTPLREASRISRQLMAATKDFEQELSNLLHSENDDYLRIKILDLMGNSRNKYFEGAIKHLLDLDQAIEVLQTAATNLGKLSTKGCFDTLINLLVYPHPNVRVGAIWGFLALGDKKAVKHLEPLLHDRARAKVWWPGPKAGAYIVAEEAARVIVQLTDTANRVHSIQ